MASQHFDVDGFYAALSSVRRSRGLTWRQVARAADVSASSLTRMAKGSRPDVDTIASLASWASLNAAAFFPKNNAESPLSMVTAYIHRDPDLTPEAASALEQLVRTTYSQLARGSEGSRRHQS
jgi:transcriptional regulator with XRE-family HTH domain